LNVSASKGFSVFGKIESNRPLGNLMVYAGIERARMGSDGGIRAIPIRELPGLFEVAADFFPVVDRPTVQK